MKNLLIHWPSVNRLRVSWPNPYCVKVEIDAPSFTRFKDLPKGSGASLVNLNTESDYPLFFTSRHFNWTMDLLLKIIKESGLVETFKGGDLGSFVIEYGKP